MRQKIIDSIDAEIDERNTLCAEGIAERILNDHPEIEDGYAQGVVYACARLCEMYDQPTMAIKILEESGVNPAKGIEYDLSFLRSEEPDLPKGIA